MPKQGQRAEVNTFIQGLITEASPLNFPPNASKDELNFMLNRDGTRNRRPGIKADTLKSITSNVNSTYNSAAINCFVWEGVNGNSDIEFLAVQAGSVVQFFNLTSSGELSGALIGSLTLTFSPTQRFSFASANGRLVIAGGAAEIYSIQYSAGTFTPTIRRLKVRDLWGVAETDVGMEADPSIRPSTLSNSHRYNLQNQSWGIPRKDRDGALVNPVSHYFSSLAKYPSNTEVVWTGLQFQPVEIQTTSTPGAIHAIATNISGAPGTNTTTTTVDPVTGEYTTTIETTNGTPMESTTDITSGAPTVDRTVNDPYERMFNNLYVDRLGADLKAARGYYIIDLLNRGASRIAATQANNVKYPTIPATPSGPPADSNSGGAKVICEYAGRVFYSGFDGTVTGGDSRSPFLGDMVVFSRLVRSDSDIDQCYQEGDPSSREGSDIVDTDGGYLRITGASGILAMHVISSKLVIFASNGVWVLSGTSDLGFSATSYKEVKLSTFGCISPESIVDDGTNLMYWGESAIYAVTPNQVGDYTVKDLTATTIQKLYDAIPVTSKRVCRGVFDLVGKKSHWVYRTGELFTAESQCTELLLDLSLNAFYQYRIQNYPTTFDYELISGFYSRFQTPHIRYLTMHKSAGTVGVKFSDYSDISFRDWGVADAKAFLLTGSQIAGDSAVVKQTPYVVMHFKKTETASDASGVPLFQSSCKFRTHWDWAVTTLSNSVTPLQQAYRYRIPYFGNGTGDGSYDNGFEIVSSRNKVRGMGRAFGLYFETEPLKDCHITGWNITLNGNSIA